MKLVAVSDTHGSHRDIKVPMGDVLIHCGDITAGNYIEEIYDFNDWLVRLPHKIKIVVAGNHDGQLEKAGLNLSSLYLSEAIYLENSGCTIPYKDKKYKVWGSPFTPRFMDWYFMEDYNKMQKYWDKIPKDTDILITHGPGYGVLDETRPNKGHLGCNELIKKIIQVKPKIHFFGHIHGSYGVKKIKDTLFVNCSICNEDYEAINAPIVVDI